MGRKRFYTDYPKPDDPTRERRWRQVTPIAYDGDKYVLLREGEEFKLGYLHHGRAGGPRVSFAYANRHLPHLSVKEWWRTLEFLRYKERRQQGFDAFKKKVIDPRAAASA